MSPTALYILGYKDVYKGCTDSYTNLKVMKLSVTLNINQF